jgi:hypothetical protein
MPLVSSPDDGLAQIGLLREKRADDPYQWVTMIVAIALLGKGETSIREAMAAGKLKYKKDGGALRICRDSILEYDIVRVRETYGLDPPPAGKKPDGRRAVLDQERGNAIMATKEKAAKKRAARR